nr:hypothetical protein [Tanacetum cinerariifolium]
MDKIICDLNKTPDLSQRPPQNCPKCENSVDDFQDTSEPSNDNTNVVNALQEPFVVKQDPCENSSQSPPQINHHCCYRCGDLLEDIFCHQCTCELCGKGAHYGYNCPSKVSIIPDPEPFNNQTVDELQKILPSFDPTCYFEDGNSFTYDSRTDLVYDSPNVFNQPLQTSKYSYEFYRNDAYYGHDCSLQVPFTYDPEPCYNQDLILLLLILFNCLILMASFDYRLNPLYPIKECSSCGALYTMDYCCSEGSLMDKIICDLNKTPDLSQRPPQNCPKCENSVDGHYCQGCALLRKFFKEDLFTYCIENWIFQDFQDTFEPSNDNTNVVNALQEPFVIKQDPCENSSQSPPQINHHCCYRCDDSLEDIFCHQCTCELCGKGAHYGYNCPLKVSIIPDPEPFNNQTVDELQKFLPSFDPACYFEDGNSFTYDSRTDLVYDSPNVFNQPLQTSKYSYEFYRNDAYYGHDCSLQVSFTYDPEPCYNQDDRPTICYNDDDDEDYTIAITPILSTKEPDNSLSMGDEHLDTIPETESDELIKSSVENLASPPDSELVSLEVMEIVILEVGGIDDDILLTIQDDILCEKMLNTNLLIANIEALKDNPTPSSDFMTKYSQNFKTHAKDFVLQVFIFSASLGNHVKDIKEKDKIRAKTRQNQIANGKHGKVQSQLKVKPDKVEATKSKKSKEIKNEGLNV